jgi:hypothetical protein
MLGRTGEQAAAAAGMCREYLSYLRHHEPEFMDEYQRQLDELCSAHWVDTIRVNQELLHDEDTRVAVQATRNMMQYKSNLERANAHITVRHTGLDRIRAMLTELEDVVDAEPTQP